MIAKRGTMRDFEKSLILEYRENRTEAAFERIVDYFGDALNRIGRRLRFAPELLADSIQDVFMWLYRNIDSVHPDYVLKKLVWELKSAGRAWYGRRNSGKCLRFADMTFDSEMSDFVDGLPDPSPGPLDQMIEAEKRRLIREAFREAIEPLSPAVKEAVRIRMAAKLSRWGYDSRHEYRRSNGQLRERWRRARRKLKSNNPLRLLAGLEAVPEPVPKPETLNEQQWELFRYIRDHDVSCLEASRRLGITCSQAYHRWETAIRKISSCENLQREAGVLFGDYGMMVVDPADLTTSDIADSRIPSCRIRPQANAPLGRLSAISGGL